MGSRPDPLREPRLEARGVMRALVDVESVLMFCRRDWVRTNDPYRVKVVLYR